VGSFHRGLKQMGCKTDHTAEVTNKWSFAIIPAYGLMACTWKTSLFFKYNAMSNE